MTTDARELKRKVQTEKKLAVKRKRKEVEEKMKKKERMLTRGY